MDIALKQRLVGASVLIALAVVVLPMLLGGRPDGSTAETRKIELPPQPSELDFQTRRYPLGEAEEGRVPEESPVDERESTRPAPADNAGAGPGALTHVEVQPRDFEDALETAESPAAPEQPVADRPDEMPAEAPLPESDPAPAPGSATAAADGGRYIVQVASFGSVDNATRLAGTLRGYGYGVLSDTVSSDVGTLHRVRVGPFDTEAEANDALARLRNQVSDVKPRIMDLRPELAAQVTAPSDPLVRWVVQLGSFSSSDNADRLVGRLRNEGLSAYKEAVSSAGSTIYRVRAGPFIDRDEAIRINGLARERLSLQGVVMSAD